MDANARGLRQMYLEARGLYICFAGVRTTSGQNHERGLEDCSEQSMSIVVSHKDRTETERQVESDVEKRAARLHYEVGSKI